MKTQLKTVPLEERILPDNYHYRTGLTLQLENSKVYDQLVRTDSYAWENGMKLNFKKTKLLLFNPGSSRDFMPKFTISENFIEMVEEVKLLGVMVRSDLSWSSGTLNSKIGSKEMTSKLGPGLSNQCSIVYAADYQDLRRVPSVT